ncbi:MAG: helix-turn-helix transcriptional regulator [Deltaproteobacteria bacterium]|nr:helix-turn-helix transcriptional regulator [Deltaproteobacteria bacterium]
MPSSLLTPYIQCFWVMQSETSLQSTAPNRILPDGCVDIIINMGDPFLEMDADTSDINDEKVYIVGAMQTPILIGMMGHVDVIGIRFKPGGAFPFFGFPINTITDRSIPLDDVWSGISSTMNSRMPEQTTIRSKTSILEDLLLKRLGTFPVLDALTLEAIRIIYKKDGLVSIRTISQNLNITGRHLERKFLKHVGISPKMLCRIVRLQYALSHLKKQHNPIWTYIVYKSGYYDQAHFIKEFKILTGLSPNAYLNEKIL